MERLTPASAGRKEMVKASVTRTQKSALNLPCSSESACTNTPGASTGIPEGHLPTEDKEELVNGTPVSSYKPQDKPLSSTKSAPFETVTNNLLPAATFAMLTCVCWFPLAKLSCCRSPALLLTVKIVPPPPTVPWFSSRIVSCTRPAPSVALRKK